MLALRRTASTGDRKFLFAALAGSACLGLAAALGSPGTALGLAAVLPVLALCTSVALLPPAVGFVAVVALLPLEAFGLLEIGFDVRPSYLALFALVCGLTARGFPWWSELRKHGWLVLFLAISALSVLLASPVSGTHWDHDVAMRAGFLRSPIQLGLLCFHFAVFILAATFCEESTYRRRLLKLYFGFGAVLSTYGLYQTLAYYLNGPLVDITWAWDPAGSSTYEYGQARLYDAGVVRFAPRATFRESMHFAHYLISFVPLAWALVASPQARELCGWSRRALAWIAGLGSLTLLFTFSRSGWGALLVAGAVLLLGLRGGKGLLILVAWVSALFGGFALLSAFGWLPGEISLWGLLSGRLSAEGLVADPRWLYFAVFIQSFLTHPWFGLGMGNFALAGGEAYGSTSLHSAHGIFWSAAADSGVLAALALVLFFGTILVRLWRRRSDEQHVLMVGLAATLAGLLAQNFFFGDRPELYLLFIAGVAVASLKKGPDASFRTDPAGSAASRFED